MTHVRLVVDIIVLAVLLCIHIKSWRESRIYRGDRWLRNH